MIIFELLYCDCVYESAHATLSLHKTKVGAYKAMRKHKLQAFEQWDKERREWGRLSSRFNWNFAQDWRIGQQELLD